MSCPTNFLFQPMVKHQQASLPYRPSLVRKKLDRKSLSTVVRKSSPEGALAQESVIPTTPEVIYGVIRSGDDLNLESSFDTSFIKAQINACTIAIKGLDLRQMCKNAELLPCTKCSEILRQGCPVPEKLLHMCHAYTEQWLSERDISWWVERFSAPKLPKLGKRSDAQAEPDLFKALGAWSIDLKCDYARDVFLLSSRIDTVPGSGQGLIDAKSQSLVLDKEEDLKEQEAIRQTQLDGETYETDTSEAGKLQSHLLCISGDDECSDTTGYSQGICAQKEFVLVEKLGEGLSTCITEPIRIKGGRDFGIKSIPTSSFESDGNSYSHNSGLSSNDQNNRQSHFDNRKRKRLQKGSGPDGSEDDEKLPVHRIPNAMPLEDPTARLACHFYMFDSYKYCANSSNGKTYKTCPVGFKHSKDLRDHIKKKHCGPKHLCSRCHEEFNDAAEKGVHEVSDPRCEAARNATYETEKFILTGTNRRVQFDLMKKPKNVSHEEHWFDTWNVIFPNHPFPTTPYMPHDAFDIAYGRITEEEIDQFMYVQTRQFSNLAYDVEIRRNLRHLVDRIRERLREEFQPEQLFGFSPSDGFEEGVEQLAPSEISSNGNTFEPIQSQEQIANDGFIHCPPSIHVTDTTMPLHHIHSAPGWDGDFSQFSTANIDNRNSSGFLNNHDTSNVGNGVVFYQGEYHDQNQDFPNFNISLGSESNNRSYDHGQQGNWNFGHSQ